MMAPPTTGHNVHFRMMQNDDVIWDRVIEVRHWQKASLDCLLYLHHRLLEEMPKTPDAKTVRITFEIGPTKDSMR